MALINKIDEINFQLLKIDGNKEMSFSEEYEIYRSSSKIVTQVR